MTEHTAPLFGADQYPSHIIHPSSLLKQMQFFAGADSAQTGCTYDKLLELGVVFVTSSITLQMNAPLTTADVLTLKTWEKEIKGPYFIREFTMKRDGELVACATTRWVLMDVSTRSLVRPDRLSGFKVPRDPASAGVAFQKPKKQLLAPLGLRTVRYSDLDENCHLNNTVYSDIAADFAPIPLQNSRISLLHIDYRKECRLGDTIRMLGCPTENGFTVAGQVGDTRCFEAYAELTAL